MDEIRTIPDFPNYSLSIDGEVYNERLDRPVAISNAGTSKASVSLWRDGKMKTRSVNKLHRQVYSELYEELYEG